MDLAAYRECRLCPRDCGVDRAGGQRGRCGEDARLRVASIGPHFGEEPPISGRRGSGTIFLSGCSSGCFFCQNWQISIEHLGTLMAMDELEREARRLIADHGVHNLNFVTPDHFWPHVRELCRRLREAGADVPFLYNCSGYQRPEIVPQYAEWMDMFMPDFKFADSALAERCMGDPRYPEIALRSLTAMVEARGFLEPWDPSGARPARTGVLVRHLVMPGEVGNSRRVLETLRREFGRHIPISVMSQYHPTPRCFERGSFDRGVTAAEYAEVLTVVEDLGFDQVLAQEVRLDNDFLPDFRRRRPFRGNLPPISEGGAGSSD